MRLSICKEYVIKCVDGVILLVPFQFAFVQKSVILIITIRSLKFSGQYSYIWCGLG